MGLSKGLKSWRKQGGAVDYQANVFIKNVHREMAADGEKV